MKYHLYLIESFDDASSAQEWQHIRRTPGVSNVNGLRVDLPNLDTKAFGYSEEGYGAKQLLELAVQRDLIHTVLTRRGAEGLEYGELKKLGEIAHKLVEEHPEMLAIRVKYNEELQRLGIDV